jgi:hypothetical protein
MKQLKNAPLIALIALSLSSSACEVVLLGASLASDDESEGLPEDGGYYATEGNTTVEAASFKGSIGDVEDMSTDADATAWDDGEFASITLTAARDGWGAMVAFELSGADREALFKPGSVINLTSASYNTYSYACSGGESDPYAYETGNQTTGVITVSEAPDDMLKVDFDVTYAGDDAASGSFTIEAL